MIAEQTELAQACAGKNKNQPAQQVGLFVLNISFRDREDGHWDQPK
jgi:hypothetical protein